MRLSLKRGVAALKWKCSQALGCIRSHVAERVTAQRVAQRFLIIWVTIARFFTLDHTHTRQWPGMTKYFSTVWKLKKRKGTISPFPLISYPLQLTSNQVAKSGIISWNYGRIDNIEIEGNQACLAISPRTVTAFPIKKEKNFLFWRSVAAVKSHQLYANVDRHGVKLAFFRVTRHSLYSD